jgi:predicted RNA binding protein YcfA (HicA-like mRNA interferase family)
MGQVFKPKQMRKLVESGGWYLVVQEGSHAQFKHPVKPGKITIPIHNEDLNKKTANSILKQAGLK